MSNHQRLAVIKEDSTQTPQSQQQLLSDLHEARLKNATYKIILNGCQSLSTLDDDLKEKLEGYLMESELKEKAKCGENHNLLGLEFDEYNSDSFLYTEVLEIQRDLKEYLQQKVVDVVPNLTSQQSLLDLNQKLLKLQVELSNNVEDVCKNIEKIAEFTYKETPKQLDEVINCVKAKCANNDLKMEMFESKLQMAILDGGDAKISRKAFDVLLKDIKNEQDRCKRDIAAMSNKLEKYDEASCAEYDELLKTYKRLKYQVEYTKKILNKLSK